MSSMHRSSPRGALALCTPSRIYRQRQHAANTRLHALPSRRDKGTRCILPLGKK